MPPPLVRMARRLPDERLARGQRLGGGEQLVEIDTPQQAGAAKRGVVDRNPIRRARRCASLQPWHRAWRPDLITTTGLIRAAARAADRNLRALDRLDIEQDRAGAAIQREVVEQVAEVDVEAVANRDDGGETNAVRADHSTKPAVMAPDCDTSARSPSRRHAAAAKLALSFARGSSMPRQFGPTSLRPVARAAFSQTRRASPGHGRARR